MAERQGGVYAWVSVEGVRGGTGAHCRSLRGLDIPGDGPGRPVLRVLDGWRRAPVGVPGIGPILDAAERIDTIWSFRRSAGQPAPVVLAYGMLAAALAKLTGGLVHSLDCAWDPAHLPAAGHSFAEHHLRPHLTSDPGHRHPAERCIADLRAGGTAAPPA